MLLGNFEPLMLINWIRYTKSETDLVLYTSNLLKRTFKRFWIQNHLLNLCSRAANSKGYCVVKKLVWNVCMKAFWYTNYINCWMTDFINQSSSNNYPIKINIRYLFMYNKALIPTFNTDYKIKHKLKCLYCTVK